MDARRHEGSIGARERKREGRVITQVYRIEEENHGRYVLDGMLSPFGRMDFSLEIPYEPEECKRLVPL